MNQPQFRLAKINHHRRHRHHHHHHNQSKQNYQSLVSSECNTIQTVSFTGNILRAASNRKSDALRNENCPIICHKSNENLSISGQFRIDNDRLQETIKINSRPLLNRAGGGRKRNQTAEFENRKLYRVVYRIRSGQSQAELSPPRSYRSAYTSGHNLQVHLQVYLVHLFRSSLVQLLPPVKKISLRHHWGVGADKGRPVPLATTTTTRTKFPSSFRTNIIKAA